MCRVTGLVCKYSIDNGMEYGAIYQLVSVSIQCCPEERDNWNTKRESISVVGLGFIFCTMYVFIAADIERELKATTILANEKRQMQLDMVRLNTIIAEKRGREQNLVQDTVLLENDFVGELKVRRACLRNYVVILPV